MFDCCVGIFAIIFAIIGWIVLINSGKKNREKEQQMWNDFEDELERARQNKLEQERKLLEQQERIKKEKEEQERIKAEQEEQERIRLLNDPEYQRQLKEKEEKERIAREKSIQEFFMRRQIETQWKIENNVPESIFTEMVKVIRKNYASTRLIGMYNRGAKVYGTICSQSGITEWDFSIDFTDRDYSGVEYITGECPLYCISCDNPDSQIPETIKKVIQKYIHLYQKFDGNDEEFVELISSTPYRELDFS